MLLWLRSTCLLGLRRIAVIVVVVECASTGYVDMDNIGAKALDLLRVVQVDDVAALVLSFLIVHLRLVVPVALVHDEVSVTLI